MRLADIGVLGWPEPVLVLTSPVMLQHQGGEDELPQRLQAVWEGISRASHRGVRIIRKTASIIQEEDLIRVHPQGYTEAFALACARKDRWFGHPDCPLSAGTWESVATAAGAGAEAVREVLAGTAHRAFCAIRPPGHHAHAASASGFCFFNNAAIAAFCFAHTGRRVAIIDLDNHHGDGTEAICRSEANIAFASIHADPASAFPGTGAAHLGPNLINNPVPRGAGGQRWLAAVEAALVQLDAFAPDALVISFGTDALFGDPLGDLSVRQEDLALAVQLVIQRWPRAPLVSLLEGGYDLPALTSAVELHLLVLATPSGH